MQVKLRFTVGPQVSGSDALPPKICVHPPRSSASMTVRWRKNTRCHQHLTVMLVEIWWSELPSTWHQYGYSRLLCLLMIATAYHVRCAIVELYNVQNYAGSRIKVAEWNVAVAESAPQANRWFVCVIRTILQLIRNVARVSRR